MAKRHGRKSAAEREVEAARADDADYLEPPEDMPPGQRETWALTVRSKPPEWFREDSIPLLEAYCQAVESYRMIRERLKSPPDRILDFQRLQHMATSQAQLMIQLATKMRLTQQSRFDRRKAGTLNREPHVDAPWED